MLVDFEKDIQTIVDTFDFKKVRNWLIFYHKYIGNDCYQAPEISHLKQQAESTLRKATRMDTIYNRHLNGWIATRDIETNRLCLNYSIEYVNMGEK